jgi:hypothetical protein
VIGGTGALGSGLARRWLKAGYSVIIGSRDPAGAWQTAAALAGRTGCGDVRAASYAEAAADADCLILTVPFTAQAAVLGAIRPALRGQLVLDTTVPLVPPSAAMVQLPETGSAAVAAQERLGAAARVVSAFHHVPARRLDEGDLIDCDVLVFGDAIDDRESAITLVEAAGLRGVHGGPLANSIAAEALTSVLIGINRYYSIGNAGLRITGLKP